MLGRRRSATWCDVAGMVIVMVSAMAVAEGGDPFVYIDWKVSYLTASPLGVKQQVIGINGHFPGPVIEAKTNWNIVVNVENNLDEPFLVTWDGLQHRRNSWQDGVLGTNCPIPPGWNWTYEFQVKDQIGSFAYFPSINFQKAAGGYGGIVIHNRDVIPIPFPAPGGDITILISDWYINSHKDIRNNIEKGKELGPPDGVLINGLGPFRYDNSIVPPGIIYETFNVVPGRTYRIRVHNVGISTCLNFRIQNHNMLLVETEGSYTIQQNYTNMDIHVGQSYSFLVTMDQSPLNDFYVVASKRFAGDANIKDKATGVAILHYTNSQGPVIGPLPDGPDEGDMHVSMTQAKSVRWNLSSGAARPNPQGSFKYREIPITDVYILVNNPIQLIAGKWRRSINGISYLPPTTPLLLARQYNIQGVFKLDFPNRMITSRIPKLDTSLINATYKGFMEVIFQNNGTDVESYHMDGYAFFVVGMEFGIWNENNRNGYNMLDAVARSTTQVFPGAWTAILVSLDNAGIWNLRSENLNSWYLGQEVYISVVNPKIAERTELPLPDNSFFCGELSSLQKQTIHGSTRHKYIHSSGMRKTITTFSIKDHIVKFIFHGLLFLSIF